MHKNGFTLTEVLVVVVILGVLAVVVFPRFFPQVERGQTAQATAMLRVIRSAEQSYFLRNGEYLDPENEVEWRELGVTPTGGIFDYEVEVDNVANPPTFLVTATQNSGLITGSDPLSMTIDQSGTIVHS